MQQIRTFVAIPLTDMIADTVRDLIDRFRELDDRVRWVPSDNLHLTLKFLGDVDNTEVHRVCQVVERACAKLDPFELEFRGTDGFPNLERARVLYVGVEDNAGALRPLVQELEESFADLGFKREPRDYTPHLTLGRCKGSGRKPNSEVLQAVTDAGQLDLGSMMVKKVCVFASFLDKAGPTYQTMDTVNLQAT